MIILFGPAGSGKSTQGRILADKFGWKWLSVGQALRDSGEFDETLKVGELVDNNEVIRLMNNEIEKADADGMNIVLDGYPRDVEQARWAAENLADKIEVAVLLEVGKDEIMDRLKKRGREDDNEAAIEKRLSIFEQNIYSILSLLKDKNVKIEKVDGSGSFDAVTERLTEIVMKNVPGTVEVDKSDYVGGRGSYGE